MKTEAIIKVENLVKEFDKFVAVNTISFEVKQDEMFAFLGPNGAGKTITIKMLTTLLHPTKGPIRISNLDPVQDQDSVRKVFGIVFKD